MATNSSNNNGSSNGNSNISIDNNSDDEKDSFDDGKKELHIVIIVKFLLSHSISQIRFPVQYGGNEVVLSACLVYINIIYWNK